MLKNLKANWYLAASSIMFFVTQISSGKRAIAETAIASIMWICIASFIQPSKLRGLHSNSGIGLKIYSALTASGAGVFSCSMFCEKLFKHRELAAQFHVPDYALYCAAFIVTCLASVFVYICVLFFWNKLKNILKASLSFGRADLLLFSAMLAASIVFAAFVFAKTDAFYGTMADGSNAYNIIYSSDSASLVNDNCFLFLGHIENDIRQPLFAVFSIPFMGLPYLFGRVLAFLFGHQKFFAAFSMNCAQIAMLLAGINILAHALPCSAVRRRCFVVLFACSYVYLLSILMMEQYITAFFWLSLSVSMICSASKPDNLILHGAGGTLITSHLITCYSSTGGVVYVVSAL